MHWKVKIIDLFRYNSLPVLPPFKIFGRKWCQLCLICAECAFNFTVCVSLLPPDMNKRLWSQGSKPKAPYRIFSLKMVSMNWAWFVLNYASFKQQKWPVSTKYDCTAKRELRNYEIFMDRYNVTDQCYALQLHYAVIVSTS